MTRNSAKSSSAKLEASTWRAASAAATLASSAGLRTSSGSLTFEGDGALSSARIGSATSWANALGRGSAGVVPSPESGGVRGDSSPAAWNVSELEVGTSPTNSLRIRSGVS